MERIEVSELTGTDRDRWEENIDFTPPVDAPYNMLRFVGGKTDGVLCLGVLGDALWIGRIFGRGVATYAVWLVVKTLAKRLGCKVIIGGGSDEGEPFY